MRTSVLASVALLLGTGVVAACTLDTNGLGPDTNNGDDAGTDATVDATTACTATGTGPLNVVVSGLPEGIAADVSIEGPGGPRAVTASETFTTAGGTYKATATRIITNNDPIVRTAYVASPIADFCVTERGATVNVTYTPIASSGKLWHINNTPSQILGFDSTVLGATGTPPASVAVKAQAGKSIAFDREGNLWAPGGTAQTISRFPAASLGTSGDKTADRTITYEPGCAPGLGSIAFASDGALWTSTKCGKRVVRFSANDLAATGSPVPGVELSGLNAPEGVAFDAAGSLWIADAGANTLVRYDSARLGASSSDAPTLVITLKTNASGDLPPNHLAFDKSGTLWVSTFNGNSVYHLTAADLSGTGTKTVIPAVVVGLPVDVLPEGVALDESGALWLTLSQGKIGRLGAGQLTTSTVAGTPAIPEIILTSADIGYSVAPAFFPAAKGTPLFAAIP